jgi:hypothetical protein
MSGDHNMNQKDNIVFRYDKPNQLLISPSAYEQHSVIYGQGNTAWAKIDKNLKLVHLDMDVCAKGPHNAYTALAMAIWNKAIETEREKVAAWMMARGYATGHGDTIEDLLVELEWQVRESEREACAKVCEDIDTEYEGQDVLATWCAAAIRARGQA